MAKRVLQASPEGIKQAKLANASLGLTQADLAREVGIKTRNPIGRFFAGQPIDRGVFVQLCFVLGLNWQDIADLPKSPDEAGLTDSVSIKQKTELNLLLDDDNIDIWLEKARDKIISQCSSIRLLDVAFPVNLDEIYVEVNIHQQPLAKTWLELSDWQTKINLEKLLPQVSALSAVAKYEKLTILGKPGSGKTTFLQYLAIGCLRGELPAKRVPIFIRLKDFAEEMQNGTSLWEYISEELYICGIGDAAVKKLLDGKMLILLDGWDEVPQEYSHAVVQQIRAFSARYGKNQYALTSRTAAFYHQLEGFAEVEIADFNQQQIEAFANKWFVAVAKNNQQASKFIAQLKLPENRPICELATNPLLLNLACLAFNAKANFPRQRTKLYQEAVDILLFKWDLARGVQRTENSCNLSLLSNLAAITFERGDYFFELSKLQPYITDEDSGIESLQLVSLTLMKSIESQSGLLVERSRQIYSFYHLIFQEYFTAQKIVNSGAQALEQLVIHITENRWREVFLNVANMLSNADPLLQLMQQQIEQLLAGDATLQQFLKWVNQKSWSFQENRQLAAVRAFYFFIAYIVDRYLALALNINKVGDRFPPLPEFSLSYLNFAQTLDSNFAVTPDFIYALEFEQQILTTEYIIEPALKRLCELELILNCVLNFDLALERNLALELQNSLQQLKAKLPQDAENSSTFQTWWETNGKVWTEELKALLINHRYAGHDWQFSDRQNQLLQQYYEANQLLIDCLNSGCEVTLRIRQQIEATLLLSRCS